MSYRIVLTTFGTFGDLHPIIAIALELRRRGHRPVIATSEYYRSKIEAEGIEFHPVRPDWPSPEEAPKVIRRLMNLHLGTRYLYRGLLMPALRNSYHDLYEAARSADLLVSYPTTPAAPLVAESLKMKWVSVVPWPLSLWSAYDYSYPSGMHLSEWFHRLSPQTLRVFYRAFMQVTKIWVREVQQFRKELGLPPGGNATMEGQYSPYGVLALFSSALAAPQPDWPHPHKVCGYCFYDKRGKSNNSDPDSVEPEMPDELREFLDGGDAPIIFTLGSIAVFDARDFYEQSALAAKKLGKRALLLLGDPANRPVGLPQNTSQIAAFDYAPFSAVFPKAAAVVHQGGCGTVGQTLRAGVPSLVVPFSFDQPDHAMRLQRMGVGRLLARKQYKAERAAHELGRILSEDSYKQRAMEIAKQIASENGVAAAADEMEHVIKAQSS